MDCWPHRLFRDGALADFLIDRWRCAVAELEEAKRRLSDAAIPGHLEELKARHTLTVAVIGTGFRIVEHGPVTESGPVSESDPVGPTNPCDFASDEDFITARILQVESRLRRLARTRTVVAVPFTGDGVIFLNRPSGCTVAAPPGKLDGQSILLWFERSGTRDTAWKTEFAANLQATDNILAQALEEVAPFNAAVAKAFQGLS